MVRAVITASLVCGVMACGDSEEDAQNKANLIGDWASECTMDHSSHEEGGGRAVLRLFQESMSYEQEKATFNESAVTWTMITSMDSSCAMEDMVASISGTYVAGADASSPNDLEGATSIDLTPTAASFTINNAEMVTAMNAMNPCSSDFEAGVAKTASECPDMLPEVGRVFKTSFKATETTLQMADMDGDETGTCTDSSGRGICFEDGLEMTRQ